MAGPIYTVEAAFVANPFGALTWTDITPWLDEEAVRWSRGKNADLGHVEAGKLELALKNGDGRFDPGNAGSPYYPYVTIRTPIRVRATYAATTYDRWRGFVERWPQRWIRNGAFAVVTPTAVDGLAITLERTYRTSYDDVVKALSYVDYWPSGSATIFTTRSGATMGSFTSAAALAGGTQNGAGWSLGNATQRGYSTTPGAGFGAMEVWFRITSQGTLSGTNPILLLISGNAVGPSPQLPSYGLGVTTGGTGPSGLRLAAYASGSGGQAISAAGVNIEPNATYHLTWDGTSVYLNGVLAFTVPSSVATSVSAPTNWNYPFVGGVGVGTSLGGTWTVLYDEFATYALSTSLAGLAQHYTLGNSPRSFAAFPAADTGARVTAVLDSVGWPAADRVVDTGVGTVVGTGSSLAGRTARDVLNEAVDSELGLGFIDGAGRYVFQSRRHATTYTPVLTFGEAETPYIEATVDFDATQVYNDVAVTQALATPAFTGTASDQASQDAYGVSSLSRSLPLPTASAATTMATVLVNRYKTPRRRVDAVSVDLRANPGASPAVLAREIGDIVGFIRRPQQGAPAISMTARIFGISERVDAHQHLVTFQLEPLPADAWIAGDAQQSVAGRTTYATY